MPEHQSQLPLEVTVERAPVAAPELRDEIAAAWSLPLGQRDEVGLRGNARSVITGKLELDATSDFPWDPHQPLRLRIAGLILSSREIDHWTRL